MRIRKVAAAVAAAGLGLMMFNPAPAQANDGSFRIVSNASSSTDPQAVDAESYGTADGTRVIAYSLKSSDQANQHWFIPFNEADGTVTIRGQQSGKCVTPTGSHGGLVLRTCDPERLTAQKWYESGSQVRRVYENVFFAGEALSYEGSDKQLTIRELDAADVTQSWRLVH